MKSLVWILPVLLSCSVAGYGEMNAGAHELTFLVGSGYSASEFDQEVTGDPNKRVKVADAGAAVGAQYIHYVGSMRKLGVGVEILNSALHEHVSDVLLKDYKTRTRFQPTTYLLLGKLAFGQGRIHPFLVGGIGFHRNSFYWDLEPKTTTSWGDTGTRENRRMIEDTATGFAGMGGIGMDVSLTRSLFLGAEARFTYLGSAGYKLTSQGAAFLASTGVPRGDFVSTNLLARVGYRFGA